jgi:prophage antirepressor-like protein
MKNSKIAQKTANKIAVFEDKKIRRLLHEGEWYFSIIDIIEILTRSPNPRRYWSNLKIQLAESEGFSQLYSKVVQLKLESSDGKNISRIQRIQRLSFVSSEAILKMGI